MSYAMLAQAISAVATAAKEATPAVAALGAATAGATGSVNDLTTVMGRLNDQLDKQNANLDAALVKFPDTKKIVDQLEASYKSGGISLGNMNTEMNWLIDNIHRLGVNAPKDVQELGKALERILLLINGGQRSAPGAPTAPLSGLMPT